MLSHDLALLYGVETKALNRAVRRNTERFPDDFMFQLTAEEWNNLRWEAWGRAWRRGLVLAVWGSVVLQPAAEGKEDEGRRIEASAAFAIVWLIFFWMYCRKEFIKI